MKFPKLGLLLAVGSMAFIAVPRASATAELILSDGIAADTVTIAATSCGGTCTTATFNGAIGSWNINVTTGTADPGSAPIMDLNSIDHHNATGTGSSGNTLTIEWTANGFPPFAPPGFAQNVGGTVGANGTVTFGLFGGNSNTLLDMSQQIGTTMSFTNPPTAFSGSESAFLASLNNPYSLTEVATITFGTNAGQASFDYSIDTVPEPAGVLLLGSAILLTVSLVRRKMGAEAKRS